MLPSGILSSKSVKRKLNGVNGTQYTFNFYDLRLSTRVKNVSCSAGNEQSIGLPENHFVVVVVLVNEYWKNAGYDIFFENQVLLIEFAHAFRDFGWSFRQHTYFGGPHQVHFKTLH